MVHKMWLPVELESERSVLLEVVAVGGEEEIAARQWAFDEIADTVRAIGKHLAKAVEAVQPRKATIEFSLKAVLESGVLLAALVNGEGEATLRVTLEW